jgi:ERCC4-related helicase
LDDHLAKFCNKAIHIYEELGPWAADYFILESVTALETLNDLEAGMFAGGRNGERLSLLQILKQGALLKLWENRSLQGPYPISSKVKHLMSFLKNQDCNECSGLLFVRQRATVSVMHVLLSIHPDTKGRFRCATFVGMSNSAAKRYTMAELLDLKAQRETLAEFRARRKNLVIATDVLEEGIDVTACNLVVCFDPPPNLKSFIQRRGRARQEKSKYAIMFPRDEGSFKIQNWWTLEENLIRAYQSELRQIQDLAAIENDVEVVPGKLEVKSTG